MEKDEKTITFGEIVRQNKEAIEAFGMGENNHSLQVFDMLETLERSISKYQFAKSPTKLGGKYPRYLSPNDTGAAYAAAAAVHTKYGTSLAHLVDKTQARNRPYTGLHDHIIMRREFVYRHRYGVDKFSGETLYPEWEMD